MMMMEASFDTEESFDDPSCLAPQPPGLVSPAKRQMKEVKETKITVSAALVQLPVRLHHPHPQQHLLTSGWRDAQTRSPGAISRSAGTCVDEGGLLLGLLGLLVHGAAFT